MFRLRVVSWRAVTCLSTLHVCTHYPPLLTVTSRWRRSGPLPLAFSFPFSFSLDLLQMGVALYGFQCTSLHCTAFISCTLLYSYSLTLLLYITSLHIYWFDLHLPNIVLLTSYRGCCSQLHTSTQIDSLILCNSNIFTDLCFDIRIRKYTKYVTKKHTLAFTNYSGPIWLLDYLLLSLFLFLHIIILIYYCCCF